MRRSSLLFNKLRQSASAAGRHGAGRGLWTCYYALRAAATESRQSQRFSSGTSLPMVHPFSTAAADRPPHATSLSAGAAGAAGAAASPGPAVGSTHSSTADGSSGGPSQQHSAIQRCLLRHGVEGHWDITRYSQHDEAWVSSNLEPKLVVLEGEGVRPYHIARLLLGHQGAPLSCDPGTFLANLQVLRELLRPIGSERLAASTAWAAGMSPTGLLVVRSPACLAQYLSGPPGAIPAAAGWLRQGLGIDEAGLANMVFARPCLLNAQMGAGTLEVLRLLDELAGEPGWGRRLLDADPLVAAAKPGVVRANLGALLAAGYVPAEICATLEQQANLLILDLSGPAYVQRFVWLREVAPRAAGWTLAALLREPRYLNADLRRAAARLAFMREQGLPDPPAPDRALVLSTNAVFCAALGTQLGQALEPEELQAWERRWLETAGGRRWGKPAA